MMKNKKSRIIFVAVIAIVVLVVLLLILFGKKDSYRIIKIHEFNGAATVNRTDVGEIEPYNNMLLESGDNIYLDTGNMTLKMDEDKYAYVEEKTDFTIRAEGSSADSRTTITVNKGSITNEIQNSLSSDATYEVNTPNSTMAVRGTIFRISTYYDENGVCYTKVSVFEGKVTSRLVYSNGQVSDEEVSISAGNEVIIYEDGTTTDYLTDVTDIDYSNLPDSVIDLLEDILGEEIDASVTEEPATDGTQTEKEPENQFVVTFTYNGKTFATQQVAEGECATVPSLMPAMSGEWDFDFTTPITENISISWKE